MQKIKIFTWLVCVISFTLCNATTSLGLDEDNIIRVGLLYNDSAISSISSVDNVHISSENGLEFLSFESENEIKIAEFQSTELLSVRKDVYYSRSEDEVRKISAEEIYTCSNEVEGFFHIKIGGEYSYDEAITKVSEYNNKGADVYLAYNGKWEIWSGNFYDGNTRDAVVDNLRNKIGDKNFSFIGGSDKRIICYKENGDVFFAYDSEEGRLRIRAQLNGKSKNIVKVEELKYKEYRGKLEVLRLEASDLTVINIVNMKEYLYGVVPFEIGNSAPIEAIKAQAVAARNYGIKSIGKHKDLKFDICNTTHCQYYGGAFKETEKTNKAIDETNNKLLVYEDELASVFYFASSGGYTESVENVWGSPIPYLVSVKDEYESEDTYHYNWDIIISAKRVKELLLRRGYDVGDVLSINATKRSPVGRVIELSVKGTKGEEVIQRSRCRTTFGLDSQWYDIYTEMDVKILQKKEAVEHVVRENIGGRSYITREGTQSLTSRASINVLKRGFDTETINMVAENYRFIGKGWGHSVGMSQVGAIGMAENGFNYEEILTHYFKGTELVDKQDS